MTKYPYEFDDSSILPTVTTSIVGPTGPTGPRARLCYATFISNTVTATSGNRPLLNIKLGSNSALSTPITLVTSTTEYPTSASIINESNTAIDYGQSVDLANTTAGGYDSSSQDLTVNMVFVLE